MPEISRFFGIVIRMYINDHDPPHFHAEYGSDNAVVRIDPMGVLAGSLPPRAMSLVVEWAARYTPELKHNWRRLHSDAGPRRIPPLE